VTIVNARLDRTKRCLAVEARVFCFGGNDDATCFFLRYAIVSDANLAEGAAKLARRG